MAADFPFHAGSMLKWADGDSLNNILGRVILLIETGNQEVALTIRNQLIDDPQFLMELLATVRPWPANIVTVDSREMNKHTTVKKVMEYKGDE